jgi:hypothetical protein
MRTPDDRSFISTSLIALLPGLLMVDGILASGVVSAIVAIAMVTVVLMRRP